MKAGLSRKIILYHNQIKREKNDSEREKTLFGKEIKSPEEFIEDLCDRMNNILNLALEENLGDEVLNEKNTEVQLSYLMGAITGLATRLNRVCESPTKTIRHVFSLEFITPHIIHSLFSY